MACWMAKRLSSAIVGVGGGGYCFEITLHNPVSCISPIITQRFYNFSYFLEMYLAFGDAGFLFSFLPALPPCYV